MAPDPPSITFFFTGTNAINPGETTYLWGWWSGAGATVDNGIGTFPNALAVDITPLVTTTYTLTVDNGAGQTVTATATIIVNTPTTTASPTTTTSTTTLPGATTTTTVPTGTTTTTTVAPEPSSITYFFAGVDAINPGETTYLWGWWSGASATVDNGIGTFPNALTVDVSPLVTTTYTLTVTNGAGHTSTATATIIVRDPNATSTTSTVPTSTSTSTSSTTTTTVPSDGNFVTISAQPVSQSPLLGSPAPLSVAATGAGNLTYQWTLDGTDIPGATAYNLSAADEGSYRVKVTSTLNGSPFTRTSDVALITTNAGTITSQPHDATITDGGVTYLNVQFQTHSSFATDYQWFRDGSEVSGATTPSIGARLAGAYRLRIITSRNGATRTQYSDTATVTVVPRPVITSFPPSAGTITTGSSTALQPVFTGGTGLITPGNIVVNSGGSVSVSPTTTTTYTLTVTNAAGSSVSLTSKVTVTTGTIAVTANDTSTRRDTGSNSLTLVDGRVLVWGGESYETVVTDVFDPTTNSFSRVGDMNQARSYAPGVRLSNGKVLVMGGQTYTGTRRSARDSSELFNPATNTWSWSGTMGTTRRNHFAVLLRDGRVLVGGGMSASDGYLRTVEIYDPATGLFTAAASMPEERSEASAIVLPDGNVLVTGGWSGSVTTDSAFLYDVATNSWSTLSSHLNYPRRAAVSLLLHDGRILIAGGKYGGLGEGHLEMYDPATRTFAPANDMPSFTIGRDGHTGHVLNDGKVVFFGGNDGYGNNLNQITIYDPASNSMIVQAATLTYTRYQHSSALLNDGRIVIIGGNYFHWSSADIFTE